MRYLKLLRKDKLAFLLRTPLQIFFGQESSFASCVSDDDATLLGGLYIALEVATDTISYRYTKLNSVFIALLHIDGIVPSTREVILTKSDAEQIPKTCMI